MRAFKRVIRRQPKLRQEIKETLNLLTENPFAPEIGTHKLKGKLLGSWACSVRYDLRIVFDFVKVKGQKEKGIFLIEIGTHDEVY